MEESDQAARLEGARAAAAPPATAGRAWHVLSGGLRRGERMRMSGSCSPSRHVSPPQAAVRPLAAGSTRLPHRSIHESLAGARGAAIGICAEGPATRFRRREERRRSRLGREKAPEKSAGSAPQRLTLAAGSGVTPAHGDRGGQYPADPGERSSPPGRGPLALRIPAQPAVASCTLRRSKVGHHPSPRAGVLSVAMASAHRSYSRIERSVIRWRSDEDRDLSLPHGTLRKDGAWDAGRRDRPCASARARQAPAGTGLAASA